MVAGALLMALRARIFQPVVLALGAALGYAATLYASLAPSVVGMLADAYVVAPYRVYALAYLAAATTLLLFAAWRARESQHALLRATALPFAALALASGAQALLGRQWLTASAVFAGIAFGSGAAHLRWPIARISVGARTQLMLVALIAFAARAAFGLQVLARTGPGMPFAVVAHSRGRHRSWRGRAPRRLRA